ncbi:endonuclease/exonuclease/phosphatase family protein [Streptomyces sp. ACA25]|uniref:endonuclease/exonuclease/phosphatase family protein n=1 Tax=Streptomyces sp. ACA25 TaxID=3022596 RepID=UPI002306F41E|nr:endonuclease/exonuclease/phosphatase family protein [Streptomyces sp. ACA25]MDB1089905.1 endonuclease/exonuclease/phosphatase family protein [Streptomyces sp. ACA25]
MSAEIRLLSYNVRSLRDDVGALARVIRASEPDVVCFQEAPRFFRWRQQVARLGRATGLVLVSGGAPACGTMIMTTLRPVVESAEDVPLPYHSGLHRRALSTAVLRFGAAARLAVISCHLSLDDGERTQQGALALERLAAMGVPAGVVAGDLNERPEGPTFGRLASELQDAWAVAPDGGGLTFPSDLPEKRIDAVLCTQEVEVLGCGVPTGSPDLTDSDLRAATDHLPVLARLRLPAAD